MENLVNQLEHTIGGNGSLRTILERVPALGLPDWYIAAGCVTQTVWNALHGFDSTYGIEDYDLIYCDVEDSSLGRQEQRREEVNALFGDLPVSVEAVNQARVHLWLPERLGYPIAPYRSSGESIKTWGAVCSCVGVSHDDHGLLKTYAPYGLDDIFSMVIRSNPETVFTKELYDAKAAKWIRKWPKLTIVPWESSSRAALATGNS